MKLFIKTIAMAMFAVLLLPVVADAQTTFEEVFEDPNQGQHGLVEESLFIPRTTISSVNLEKTTFAPGETIEGSVTLINNSNESDGGIEYRAELSDQYNSAMRIYENTVDLKVLGTVSLNAGQTKTIQFSYTLPQTVAGDGYALTIGLASTGGLPMDLNDTAITIEGEALSSLAVVEEYVSINESQFNIQEGPTVQVGDTAVYNLKITNESSEDITVTPTFSIDRFGHDTEQQVIEFSSVTVVAGETKDLQFDLPTFNNTSGVYTADFALLDGNGINRMPFTSVRYIVGGSSATIKSVSTDITSGARGDIVNVAMDITGTPLDLSTDERDFENQLVEVSVVLVNESGKQVGSARSEVNLTDSVSVTVPVTLTGKARAIMVQATVSEGGSVLAQKTLEVSGDYNDVDKGGFNAAVLITIIILGVIAIIAGIVHKKHAETITTALLLTLVVAAGVLSFMPANAEAWSRKSTTGGYGYATYFTFNSESIGVSNATVSEGEDIVISGTAYTIRCSNKTAHGSVTYRLVSLADGSLVDTYVHSYTIGATGGNSKTYYGTKTGYTFTGDYDPGAYVLYVDVYGRDNNGRVGGVTYQSAIQIGDTTAELTSDQAGVVQGETVTLSWNATNTNGCMLEDNLGNELMRTQRYATGSISGSEYLSITGSATTTPTVTTTYTLYCSNIDSYYFGGSEFTDSVTVGVVSTPLPPAEGGSPSIDISVEENPVDWNTPAHIIWTTVDADSCEFTEGLSGTVAVNGDEFTENITEDTTVTISCTNSSGTTVESVTVNVTAPSVTVVVSASPTTVESGGSVSITWAPFINGGSVMADTAFDSCVASGNWSGSKNPAGGTESVTPTTQPQSTYSIDCYGLYGQEKGSVDVPVGSGDSGSGGGGDDDGGDGSGGDDGNGDGGNGGDSSITDISCGAFQSGNQVVKANMNSQVQWSVTVSPTASYTYEWTEGGQVIGDQSIVNVVYTTPGTKNVHVDVLEGGSIAGICDASVIIQNPVFEEF